MQLTRYTDYGLRLLTYLAVMPENELATKESVCAAYDLSPNHIGKIVHQLGKAGYLDTRRGKGGGFRLGKSPGEINLGSIVRLLERDLDIFNCQEPRCQIQGVCQLHGMLQEAAQGFLQVLDKYTLADMVYGKQQQLTQILRIVN